MQTDAGGANLTVNMQWSKLRSRIRALICQELRHRIDFHATSYRHSHDESEKVWITVDGERLLTASWYQHQWFGWPKDDKGRLHHEAPFAPGIDKTKNEVHRPQDVGSALRAYIDMPIEEAFNSTNPFIRALSLVDRRIGRRTLDGAKVNEGDHSLVREFHRLRVNAISGVR